MTRRPPLTRIVLVVLGLSAAACASHQSRMHLALDASMERVLWTEAYLRNVSGISVHPSRLSRGDGYVYLADVAPQLRYLAETGDTVRYRALRTFVVDKLMRRDSTGLSPLRAHREGSPSQPATQYGVLWLRQALRDGWQAVGDTLSAVTLAQMRQVDAPMPAHATRMYQLTTACGEATEVAATDPAPARAVLATARTLVGTPLAATEQAAAGVSAAEGELDLLSCLTRAGLALRDPDATVRYLDRLLDVVGPLLVHSGRPDLGTTADVLLTLHRVRDAGPSYYAVPAAAR